MANTPGLVKGAAVVLAAGASAGRSRRTHIGWLRDFRLIDRWLRRFRGAEKATDALDTGFAVRIGQEHVMPDAMEALGQYVQEETSDELAGFERQRFVPGGAGSRESLVMVPNRSPDGLDVHRTISVGTIERRV